MDPRRRNSAVILVVVILVSILILGLLFIDEKKETAAEGYTGWENIQQAFELANNDTNTIVLCSINCKYHTSNGRFKEVNYRFREKQPLPGPIPDQPFYILPGPDIYMYVDIIFEYGKDPLRETTFFYHNSTGIAAKLSNTFNFIDTDTAYEIASSNYIIQQFMKDGPNHSGVNFWGAHLSNHSDVRWYFDWEYKDDDRGHAYITIDAANGDVISVAADGVDIPEEYDDEPIPLSFTVEDGLNRNHTRGCFFLLRAGEAVDIYPADYSFHLNEKGYSPKKLDLDIRTYDTTGIPSGGDRNTTYDYTEEGERWSEGEYLGFDMPMADMALEMIDGTEYEVGIQDSVGEWVWQGEFVYVLNV